ncbi:MAG: hypothetical protein ABWY06_24365 [Pseudomonas sp.]
MFRFGGGALLLVMPGAAAAEACLRVESLCRALPAATLPARSGAQPITL